MFEFAGSGSDDGRKIMLPIAGSMPEKRFRNQISRFPEAVLLQASDKKSDDRFVIGRSPGIDHLPLPVYISNCSTG